MIDAKLAALQARGAITEAQTRELRKLLAPSSGAFPSLGDAVRLVEDPGEAIEAAHKGRYSLLGLARDPNDPERVMFVLSSGAASRGGKRFGGPRTWLLFGVALGALVSVLVRLASSAPEPEAGSPATPPGTITITPR
jgi:hypothetical protein